jgi:hypothetical protein
MQGVARELNGGCTFSGWLDHWGTVQEDWCDVPLFVTEPYGVWLDEFERFAEMINCEWRMSASSWHYPGNTYRCYFKPKEMCHE